MRFLFLLLLFPQSICAYELVEDFVAGYYWQRLPVKMRVTGNVSDDLPRLRQLTLESMQEWEDAIGVDVLEHVEDSSQVNTIRYSNNFAEETGFDEQSVLAVAVRYSEGPYMSRGEIILNGQNQLLRQNVSNLLYKTLLHELGHIIGLDHSQEYAIMQANVGAIGNLTDDDQQGGIAVVNETLKRQSEGYTNNQQGEEQRSDPLSIAGCGTIDTKPPSSGYLWQFIVAMLLTIFMGRKSQVVRVHTRPKSY
jgi:hypothetical protein